jgi:hypothetical protein
MFIMTLLLSITVYSICFSGCTLFTCLVLSSLTRSTSLLCSLDLSLGKKLLLYPSSWLATEPRYSGYEINSGFMVKCNSVQADLQSLQHWTQYDAPNLGNDLVGLD